MTIPIIILTVLVSALSFQNQTWFNKLKLNPYRFYYKKEWTRILSHGFIHADWVHLLVNMFVLYSFGRSVEYYFSELKVAGYLSIPILHFLLLYFGGIVFSSIPSILKQKNNEWYNSVGASGGVSAIVFASIFFAPLHILYLYFIPIPGIVFGILYLAYSHYMSKRNRDNINHEAHITGAIYGFLYPLVIDPSLIKVFFSQLNIF